MEKLVSIIVPVYNVENYIDQCLQSLTAQTYQNIEILIINDGSSDNSRNISVLYAEEDNRIQIFDKENGGLSSARNLGLQHAKGEYIFFIDSDDWIELDTISTLVSLLENNDADISICGVNEVGQTITRRWPPEICVLSNLDAINELCKHGEKICITVWNKLYKRELFKYIKFEESKIHEDIYFTPKILFFARKIAVNTEPKYNYLIRRPNSICNQAINLKRLDSVDGFISDALFFEKNNLRPFSQIYFQKAFGQCMSLYCQATYANEKSLAQKIKCYFHEIYKLYYKKSNLTLYGQCKVILFSTVPTGYYYLWKKRHYK